MFRRFMIKTVIQSTLICGAVLFFGTVVAQEDFPRVAFLCPYSISPDSFEVYDHYWPQMDSCGLTHVVTYGDNESLKNSANLYVLNALKSNVGNVWRYSMGVENDYPVGGNYPQQSYFDPDDMETGDDFEDGIGQYVFQMLCDRDSAGFVFNGYFDEWHQYMERPYFFTFTMKMDGDTSIADPVAEVHIWEQDDKSDDQASQHGGLLGQDSSEVEFRPPADTTVTIYSDDFLSPGEYEYIELDSIELACCYRDTAGKVRYYETHVSFKWLDTRDLYVDHLDVRDIWNYKLFVSEDSIGSFTYIQTDLANRDAINPDLNYRFYVDEPRVNQYKSYNKVDDLSRENPGDPLNGATSLSLPKWDPLEFAQSILPDELIFNSYTIHHYISNSSSGDNSLQKAWDRLIHGDSTWFGMRYAKNAAETIGCRFWMFIQACEDFYKSGGQWNINLRAPTPAELSAEANLTLCYGATGIIYYPYPTTVPGPNDNYKVRGLVTLVNSEEEPIWQLDPGCHYVPNERWYAAQEINTKIDSLADVLLSLDWQDAFIAHPDIVSSHATFVDSLYSSRFVPDSTYIEIGIFDSGVTDYMMLVNRRCLSTEKDTVAVCIDTTTHNFRVLYDVYENKTYHRTNGEFSNIPLEPGEGKLFELSNTLRVSGSITENTTWGDGLKIFVVGDVTVETDVTLTIEPGTIVEFAMTDNQHSGDDSTKSELIVYGTLNAVGSSGVGDSVVFNSNSDSPSKGDWYGIVQKNATSNSSRIDFCKIEYAYKGVSCYKCSSDVRRSSISNCEYGAYVDTDETYLLAWNVNFDSCSYGVRVNEGAAWLFQCDLTNNSVGAGYFAAEQYFKGALSREADINDCDIQYNSTGILCDDSSPIINDCDISYNTLWGVKCIDDSDPIIGENDITDNGESTKSWSPTGPSKSPPAQYDGGLFCSGTSCPIVCDGRVSGDYKRGWNVIVNNNGDGVYCGGQSSPKLGKTQFPGLQPGENSLGDNIGYDVCNTTGSTVYAQSNYWGEAPPDTSEIYGPVNWNLYYSSPPKGAVSGSGGRFVTLNTREEKTRSSTSKGQDPDSTGTAEEYNELGTYYLLQMMYDEAIEVFQYVLTNFHDCAEANYALVHLMHCYREGGYQADIFPYLQNLSSSSLNPELKNLALYMSISQLCRDGQYGQALKRCQVLLAAGCDEEMEKSLRLREGMLYRYGLDDDETAIAAFQDFITRYSEDPLTSIAQVELEILGVSQPPKATPGAPVTKPTVPLPESFALHQNYPNPFNARTCIEYELPQAAQVSVKIYNILGQQVKTLTHDHQPAGRYQVFWDGRDGVGIGVASGIYFIRLEAGTYALTRKTVLLR